MVATSLIHYYMFREGFDKMFFVNYLVNINTIDYHNLKPWVRRWSNQELWDGIDSWHNWTYEWNSYWPFASNQADWDDYTNFSIRQQRIFAVWCICIFKVITYYLGEWFDLDTSDELLLMPDPMPDNTLIVIIVT